MPAWNMPRTAHGRGRYVDPLVDDNLLNFNEGTSTTGWSVSSGSGTLSQASSSVRLTSTAAAVVAELSLAGPASNDALILLRLSAKYTASQYGSVLLKDGGTTVLEVALGYDLAASSALLGCISARDGNSATGNVIATSVDYEATPQDLCIHIDRDYSAVNLWLREAGGKWDFRGSFAYSAGYASLDTAHLSTSAHSGQWIEYDWLGFARPNMVSIGDSICAGHNFFDPDPSLYGGEDDADNTWQKHALVYQSLRNTLIVNKGVGGDTSTEILARIAQATAHSARRVYLHASSNDQVSAISKATRSANIQDCIDAITATGADCVLLNAMYATSGSGINPAHRTYMAEWWASDRLALTGVRQSIDIMQAVDDGDYQSAALTEGDGIHPTAAGYQAIGEQITAA